MLKLPICPYCGYKFDYSRSSRALHGNAVKCRKCGKLMNVSYKLSAAKTAAVFFVFLVVFNVVYLFNTKNQTIIPNIIITIVFIILYIVIVPLQIKFSTIPGQEDPPEKLKKNRHRHKKTKNQNIEFNENPIENTIFDQ